MKRSMTIVILGLTAAAWLMNAAPAFADVASLPSWIVASATANGAVGDVASPAKSGNTALIVGVVVGGIVVVVAVGSIIVLRRIAKRPSDEPRADDTTTPGNPR
jgi:hypothetical protein